MAGEWNSATFQFDPVGQSHTFSYILDKFENFMLMSGWERPSWDGGMFGPGTVGTPSTPGSGDGRYFIRSDRATQDRWRFTADLSTQHCGIFIWYNVDAGVDQGNGYEPNLGGPSTAEESGPAIVIQTFLENTTPDDVQIATPDHDSVATGVHRFGSIRLHIDTLAVNNYLIYGGEDGLYIEVGRDSFNANLGHGAVMVFGEIPEFNGTRDEARQWTAQGLVCDMLGTCRFTEDRNDRFVSNDGTNKNFTASLHPFSARGTASLDVLTSNVFDQRAYYIGSRDNFLSAIPFGATTIGSIDTFGVSGSNLSTKYAASFGLLNTPKNDRIRISPLFMVQQAAHTPAGATSASASNNIAATGICQYLDVRTMRQVFRFTGADHTLIPFLSVVDSVSGGTFRIGRMDDNGRFSQFGVEVPTSIITLP